MGYRLSKIYTRTGDKGTTGLGDGSRVPKNSDRVEAYGAVDELNSMLGVLLADEIPPRIRESLEEIQHDLFDLGGELSIPGHEVLREERVSSLEDLLDELNADLEPLQDFILPGGSKAAAYCHLARTVCRRAERRLVTLRETQDVRDVALSFLNRLSDLLFVLARTLNQEADVPDVLWDRER